MENLKKGMIENHLVDIDPNSALYKIIGEEKGEVNSAHHQSVDMPGFDLVVNALSPDGIVEGMERREPGGKSFLMLIQWHPERMTNMESVFAKSIKQNFINTVRQTI